MKVFISITHIPNIRNKNYLALLFRVFSLCLEGSSEIPIFEWCYVNLTDSRVNRIWSCTSPELWIFTNLYTEVVLFFFSFKSPAVFIFYHARSTDFEDKIEGLWTGSIFTGHAWSYEILICFTLIQVTYSWHTYEYLQQLFAIRRGQHSQNC